MVLREPINEAAKAAFQARACRLKELQSGWPSIYDDPEVVQALASATALRLAAADQAERRYRAERPSGSLYEFRRKGEALAEEELARLDSVNLVVLASAGAWHRRGLRGSDLSLVVDAEIEGGCNSQELTKTQKHLIAMKMTAALSGPPFVEWATDDRVEPTPETLVVPDKVQRAESVIPAQRRGAPRKKPLVCGEGVEAFMVKVSAEAKRRYGHHEFCLVSGDLGYRGTTIFKAWRNGGSKCKPGNARDFEKTLALTPHEFLRRLQQRSPSP